MSRRVVSIAVVAIVVLLGGRVSISHAEPPSASAIKDAGKRFQRGVALYTEADYRAALVEFRKAYEIAPNATVLYNIGQTYYQLQNYAAALTTLEQYLTEAGANAAHRSEVESTIEILQSRVGKVAVSSTAAGCEVHIDDELVGTTPLREPALVSIGRRKVSVLCTGQPAENRFVDVAAGETRPVQLSPAASSTAIAATAGRRSETNYAMYAWVATGIAGATALTSGALAFKASRDLKSAREADPVPAEEQAAKAADLDKKSSAVRRWSLIADIAGVATLVAGGVAVKLTLSKSSSHEVSLGVVPNGIQLAGSFR